MSVGKVYISLVDDEDDSAKVVKTEKENVSSNIKGTDVGSLHSESETSSPGLIDNLISKLQFMIDYITVSRKPHGSCLRYTHFDCSQSR